MPTIIFAPTAQVQQVDDFPENCTRSVEGALHIRPGATAVVTDQEAAHLYKKGIKYSVSGRAKAPLSKAATDPAPASEAAVVPVLKTLPDRPVTPFSGGQPDGAGEPEQK